MPGYRLTTDAPTNTSRDDAKRVGKGAIALLALGAPFVAVAPATAQGGDAPQPTNPHGQAVAGADASAAAAPQSGDAGPPGGAAATETAGNATPHSGVAAAETGGNATPQSGVAAAQTSGDAEASSNATAAGNTAHSNATETGGQGNDDISDHGRAASSPSGAATGHSSAPGDATATVSGNTGARGGGEDARGSHEARASARVGADARGSAAAGAPGAAEAEGRQDLDAEGKGEARSNGRAGGAAHARTEADHRSNEARHGARGFTDVRVRAHEEARPGGRVSTLVKASPALEAAIRAEAREAAREEIRERFTRPEGAQAGTQRFAVKRRFEGAGSRAGVRPQATSARAEALPRAFETMWTDGGPARTNALWELCLGRRPSDLPGLLTALRAHALAERHGDAEGQGSAEGQGGAEGQGNIQGSGNAQEAGAAMQQRQLPFTGSEVPLLVIAGAATIAAGALLRRRIDGTTRRS